MRIPEEKIEEVRNSVSIVEVIGSAVRLKKAGKNYIGLCPFHEEKTPSFSVNSEMQIYKCFGCGEGGNVFTFLMKDQNISFIEAVRQIAEQVGISLPRYQEDTQEKQRLEKLYAVNEFAAGWFSRNLRETPDSRGKKALDYLLSRGFKDETVRAFEIGFAPDSWEALLNAAAKASYEQQTLLEAGLAIRKSPESSPYDRFRNRIIFPIKNEFGRTVGFGARKFDENDDQESPKYINSPESPVYHKGRLLYGLFQNKETIRKKDMVILVEGYTDVMALFEHGIGFAAATLGTALTPLQGQLINRYTKNVVLLYDADTAGVKAALRGADVLFGAGLDVQVVNLGGNSDPDSFLRNNPKEVFIEAIENRRSVVDFYAASFADTGKDLPYNEKSGRIRNIIDLVDSVKDPLKRELMLKEIGEKLSTDYKTIFKEFYRKKRSQFHKATGQDKKLPGKPILLSEIDQVELDLGSIVINSPGLARALLNSIEIDNIRSPHIMKIIEVTKKLASKKKQYSPADLVSAAEDENLQKIVTGLAFNPHEFPKQNEEKSQERLHQVADDIVTKLRLRRINRDLDTLQEQIKKAEAAGNDTTPFVSQFQVLMLQKNEMTHPQAI